MSPKADDFQVPLRVRIRPRFAWRFQFSAALIALIIAAANYLPAWDEIKALIQTQPILSPVVLSGIALAGLYAVLWMLFSSELIILNETTLEIQSWILSINLSQRNFLNSTIENLRYEEKRGRYGAQSRIRFESAGETITFAREASRSDSSDLINRMLKVYKFPMQEPEAEES